MQHQAAGPQPSLGLHGLPLTSNLSHDVQSLLYLVLMATVLP